MTVIIALKKVRTLKGFSQNDLARETGYSTQHIQKIEQGRVKSVTLEALEKLCRALKCLPGDLFEIVSDPVPPSSSSPRSRSKGASPNSKERRKGTRPSYDTAPSDIAEKDDGG